MSEKQGPYKWGEPEGGHLSLEGPGLPKGNEIKFDMESFANFCYAQGHSQALDELKEYFSQVVHEDAETGQPFYYTEEVLSKIEEMRKPY
jgi:hypothetical protein